MAPQMTGLEMQELLPHTAGDAEQKKLLVDIVQGLLMAHARLDAMDEALRRTVESASLRHLDAFHVELRTVDERFGNTASDLERTIGSLAAVREQLLQTVEGASTKHLEAFTEELRLVDARFQETAGQVDGTVQSLQAIRDNLVRSVEASTAQHADAFSQQVGGLQKSIEQLERTQHEEAIARARAQAMQIDSLDLDRRLTRLADGQTAHGVWAGGLSTLQITNWANLNGLLNKFLLSTNTAHAGLNSADREIKEKITNGGLAVREHFAEIRQLIEDMDASHLQEMRGVHMRLNWFIFLTLAALAVASSIVFCILRL